MSKPIYSNVLGNSRENTSFRPTVRWFLLSAKGIHHIYINATHCIKVTLCGWACVTRSGKKSQSHLPLSFSLRLCCYY